ncbi:MAG TPA: hypothetical protein VFD70_19865 [Anaerolineae bacterium]|nr:hypothetical protein [Anaerolineae bacterium]
MKRCRRGQWAMASNNRISLGTWESSSGATARVGLSGLSGLIWGFGWAVCVEMYRGGSKCILFGCGLSPSQLAGLSILLAAGEVGTLALVYHVNQPFLRALLCALVAACLTAFFFYVGLTLLAAPFQNARPMQLEEWLLPLGWGLDNAALWLVMQRVDAPKQLAARLAISCMWNPMHMRRKILYRLVLIALLGSVWLGFIVARSAVSIGIMLAITPPLVWGGLALDKEV